MTALENESARNATSAAPRWTSAICASIVLRATCTAMRSAKPSGRERDGSVRKYGLRTRSPPRSPAQAATRYGPVPGGGRPCVARAGLPAGTTEAQGMVSLCRNSASGRARWIVIVRARASLTIPRDRSQRPPRMHRRAPRMPAYIGGNASPAG